MLQITARLKITVGQLWTKNNRIAIGVCCIHRRVFQNSRMNFSSKIRVQFHQERSKSSNIYRYLETSHIDETMATSMMSFHADRAGLSRDLYLLFVFPFVSPLWSIKADACANKWPLDQCPICSNNRKALYAIPRYHSHSILFHLIFMSLSDFTNRHLHNNFLIIGHPA